MNAAPAIDTIAWLAFPVDPQLCWLTSMSLVHSLWQGLLLAGLIVMILRMKKLLSVHQRFAACFGMLLLIGLMPIVNFLWLSRTALPPAPVAIAQEKYQAGELSLFTLHELSSVANANQATRQASTSGQGGYGAHAISENPAAAPGINWPVLACVLATALYCLGAGIMFVRMGLGLRAQTRLIKVCTRTGPAQTTAASLTSIAERAALSLGKSLKTRILLFQGQGMALVVGIVRPLILVNASLISGLTTAQLEQIIAHELAHVYRWDPLTQFVQRIIESLLFFHPAVWFVSRQVSRLREHCCDEWVAGQDSRLDYAQTLLQCAALNQGAAAADSRFSLAATGAGTTQLSTRIESLLQPSPATPNRRSGNRRLAALVTVFCVVPALIFWWMPKLWRPDHVTPTPVMLQEMTDSGEEQIAIFDDSEWTWQQLPSDQLSASLFMFGGQELALSGVIPEDINVAAMIDQDSVQFAQWHFGDANSTRVAILAEMENGEITRLFVDRNRDRTIGADEEVTVQANRGKTWVVELMAEVVEQERRIHSPRQIGISPKLRSNAIRVNTLGHVDGTIELNGQSVAVRRIDNDGNGLPVDLRDQLWIDLDGDGSFDPLTERKHLHHAMEIEGQRYAIRSDRLGQSIKLTPDNQRGMVRFQLDLADKTAVVESLEGSLRDESGLLIAIRVDEDPVLVPAGRYCIENLVVHVRDTNATLWRMTLTRGFQNGWFDVATEGEHLVKLLESLDLHATPFVDRQSRPGLASWIQPYIYTPNGLVITRFDRQDANRELPDEGHVPVDFQFRRPGEPEPQQTRPCQSGFG